MFSSDLSPSVSSTTLSNSRPHKHSSAPVIAGTLAGCIVLIACVLTFILIRKRRRRLLAEYASHFHDPRTFPPEHSDKGDTLGEYTAPPLPRPPGSASSSGSSSAPPPLHSTTQQHDHPNHIDGPHDHQIHPRRTQAPSPLHYHHHHHHQNTQSSPNYSVRPFPAPSSTQLPARLHSDLAGRPHGHIDAIPGHGTEEDVNNNNNNSNNIPGANHEPIFGSARNPDVDGTTEARGRREMDVSAGGGGPSADVLPAIIVTRDIEGGTERGDGGETPPPLNSSELSRGGAGRRGSAQSTETGNVGNGVAEEMNYRDGGRDGGGQGTSGTSASGSGLEYPYPGFVAGPNEDAGFSNPGIGSVSRPPSSSSPPSSPSVSLLPPSPTISAASSPSRRIPSWNTLHHSSLENGNVPPTSIPPVFKTQVHAPEEPNRTTVEEDAPPAYENIWPDTRGGEFRRAELSSLQQGRD